MYKTYLTVRTTFLRKIVILLLFVLHQSVASAGHNDKNRLIVIDDAVQTKEYFLQQRGANDEVLILHASDNITTQLLEVFKSALGFDELHLITHGQPGKLIFAGGATIDAAFVNNARNWDALAKLPLAKPVVYLYGCNVAKGDAGKAFVQLLSEKYGSRVYASTDVSGGVSTDGDSVLEFSAGESDINITALPLELNKYAYTLQTYNFTTSLDARNEHWTTAYLPVTTTYTEGANDVLRLTLTESGTAGNGSGCVVITINGSSGLGQLSPSACGYGNSNNWDKTLSVKKNAGLSFGGGSITFKPITYNPSANPATQELLLNFYIRGFKNGTQTGEIHRTNLVHNQNYTIDISAETGFADIDDLQFFIDNNEVLIDQLVLIPAAAANSAPTDMGLSSTAVNENVAANTTVGTLSSTDPDAGNTFTYSLVSGTGSTDNASFNISGSSLRITNSPDFETKSSYSVRVRTTDQGGLTYEEVFSITINNINETPTDMGLSSTSVNENVAANTTVGTLSSTDPDAGNTFTYSLVSGTGSTDNASFNISGSSLRITNSPDFETKNSYSVRVRTIDQGGLTYEEVFTITINNVNEAPADISLSANTVNENVADNSVVGTFSSTDVDAGNTFTYTLVSGTGSTDNASFTIAGNNLQINLSPDFETKASYSIRIQTADQGGLSTEKVFTVAILNINEDPTDIVLSVASVNENAAANSVIGTFSTNDPEGNNHTYSFATGRGDADNALFTIVGNILRINVSPDFETKNIYSIRIRTTDAGGLFFEKSLTVIIDDVNETPTDMSLSAAAINENVAANTAVGLLSSTDPDAGNTFTYTLVAGTGSTDNASFNISGNTLRIAVVPDFETKNSYSIRLRSTDQDGLFVEKVFTISISDLLDNPVINVTGALAVVNTTYGTPSATPASFTLSASFLTSSLSITAPAGYEISESVSAGYATALNIVPVSGNISARNIYVRLSATASVAGAPYSGNILASSTGAPDQLMATAASTVSPKTIQVTGIGIGDKIYDALLNATITGTPVLTGVEAGDAANVILGGTATAVFSDAGVGNNKAVTVSGYAISGTASSNYTVLQPAGLTASVTTRALTISGIGIGAKVYDGLTNATITGAATLNGLIAADAANVLLGGTPVASFITAAAGINKAVSVTGYTITGSAAANYTLTQPVGLTASVTARPVTISGIGVSDKIYDGLTTAFLNGNAVLNGVLAADVLHVVLSGTPVASFSTANAESNKTISISGYSLSGSAAANYSLTQPTGLTAAIQPRALTVSGIGISDKTYDGSTSATITGTAVLYGVVAADAVNVVLGGATTAAFATADVGTGKSVTVNGFSITGSAASNYTLVAPTGFTASITPASLVVTANAVNKVYGQTLTGGAGSTAFTVTGLQNRESAGTLTVSYGSGSAATDAAGTYAGAVTVSGLTGGTFLASNYLVVYRSAALIVDKALLTITANNRTKTYGTTLVPGTTAFTTAGLQNSDQVNAVTLSTSGAAATSATGNYSMLVNNAVGVGLENYNITYVNGVLSVTPALLVITADNLTKTYGTTLNTGTTAFSVSGLLNNDVVTGVTLTSNGAVATAAAGTYTITPSAALGSGLDKYVITYTDGALTVNRASLTITAENQVKCAGTSFNIPANAYTVNGLLNNDQVNRVVLSSIATNTNINAGTYAIEPSGATGPGLDNYIINYVNGLFTVSVLPAVTASSNVSSISKGGTITLTATGAGNFRWSPVANLSNANSAVTAARVTATTTYTVQITDANGCVNNASVTVNAIEDLAVEVPLAFTPNGDGINDRFIIRNLDQYPQNTLQVFDRTGKIIYQRENYNNDWNGMVNGKMITRDTYFYILTIKGKVVKKGAVTVVL